MDCDRCNAYVSNTFRVFDVDGNEEWVCVNCRDAAESKPIPRVTGWDEPGAYR